MEILFYISLGIYLMYNIVTLSKFRIPVSLSDTHYLLIEENKKNQVIFTIILWAISLPLLIYGLDITPKSCSSIIFVTAVALMFVGASPFFKKNKTENLVHTISAIICSIGSVLWGFFVGDWKIACMTLVLMSMFFISKDKLKTYLIETILFVSLYLQMYLFALK